MKAEELVESYNIILGDMQKILDHDKRYQDLKLWLDFAKIDNNRELYDNVCNEMDGRFGIIIQENIANLQKAQLDGKHVWVSRAGTLFAMVKVEPTEAILHIHKLSNGMFHNINSLMYLEPLNPKVDEVCFSSIHGFNIDFTEEDSKNSYITELEQERKMFGLMCGNRSESMKHYDEYFDTIIGKFKKENNIC